MSLVAQSEWDETRLEILTEAAEFTELAVSHPNILAMLVSLTRAFDHPVPVYSVYRKLRSFKAGQWPLIRHLVSNVERQSVLDQVKFNDLLIRVAGLLDTADANRDVLTEQLEIELQVLKTLIDDFS